MDESDLNDTVNAPATCAQNCTAAGSIETLNSACYCLSLDEPALRTALAAQMGPGGPSSAMLETHPHLFSSVPMFVSRRHLDQMAQAIAAVEAAVSTAAFRDGALAWAPEIARFDPGPRGGLLGYDFHLGPSGPRLIEINTNPGGAMLNAVMGRAHKSCCAEVVGLAMAPMEADDLERSLVGDFRQEWQLQRGTAPLGSIAIVDERPESQYLYPEFLLYRELFSRHGIETVLCDPAELTRKDGRLWRAGLQIDLVYNRLTDFAFAQPVHDVLRHAYVNGEVVVTPNPRAHALYADKRNLALLGDEALLESAGLPSEQVATLLIAVPRTELMTPANREVLWAGRRDLFFKPATGYGSKAAYRGAKLTKRVWEEMASGTYVAQALVAPSERSIEGSESPTALKADIRNYAYSGVVRLVTARLYQGQTTNFRTPGGGFAPVFTAAN